MRGTAELLELLQDPGATQGQKIQVMAGALSLCQFPHLRALQLRGGGNDLGLGAPVVPFYPLVLGGGEGSPAKIDYRKRVSVF